MAWLDKAVEMGFSSQDKLDHDPDIAFLRTQPGFAATSEKADALEMGGNSASDWLKFVIGEDDERWAKTAAHHKLVLQKYPQSGRAWFNYGFSSLRAGDRTTAVAAFQHAIQLGHRIGTSSYNIACAYALDNNKDLAFEWLKRARNAGFNLDNYLDDDDDLDSLRRDPRFKALVASVEPED
jgi:tetratricopeptide (TPR) repeat protein